MSSNRFFVLESGLEGDRVRLSVEQAHQVCHVLRLKVGDQIVVLDNAGFEYDATLTTVTKRAAVGQIENKRTAEGEPNVAITLFQSLLSREKFEWVLQKGTEVGVSRFVPVQTSRSIVRAKQIDGKKLVRWRKIVTEAAEQSHRGRIPRIDNAINFAEAVAKAADFDLALIPTPDAKSQSLKQALAIPETSRKSVAVFIGPEGGFASEEINSAGLEGISPTDLGPRVLRAETAGLVSAALILHELDAIAAHTK